jgi:hypothetical protein
MSRLGKVSAGLLLIVGIGAASRSALAGTETCQGWTAIVTWNGPAYAVMTASLYLEGSSGPVLVENSTNAQVQAAAGTMTFTGSWVSTPLNGTYQVLFNVTVYSDLDHVPSASELASWPSNLIFYLSGTSDLLTCTPPPPSTGCTLTIGYWKNHNAFQRRPSQHIPWPISENTQLCGMSWLDILNTTPAGGDAWYILAHQWIAARLNQAGGASSTPDVTAAMQTAATLLGQCSIPASEQSEATGLANTLDEYNNGIIGPGHCQDTFTAASRWHARLTSTGSLWIPNGHETSTRTNGGVLTGAQVERRE